MPDKDRLLDLMHTTGAIMKGHFLLTSGMHSDVYLEKFRVLEKPDILDRIGRLMAGAYQGEKIDVVLGAAMGGILLSHATGKALGTKGIFAERVQGNLTLRRGFELNPGERVLIVEDIVTTGGSIRELIGLVEESGANLVGVACLVDRTETGIDFGYPTKPLLRYPSPSWEPDRCPLCKEGILIETKGRTGKD